MRERAGSHAPSHRGPPAPPGRAGRSTPRCVPACRPAPAASRRRDRTARHQDGRARRASQAHRARRTGRRRATRGRHSWSSHRPMTLRSSRVVPSTPRSLVRLKAAASAPRNGSADLQPEQRPGARGEHRRALARAAAPRRTPTRCHARRPSTPGSPRAGACARSTPPSGCPGSTGSPENGAEREADTRDQLTRPPAGAGVEQPRGRRGGHLVCELAGQPQGDAGRGRARSSPLRARTDRRPRRRAGRSC